MECREGELELTRRWLADRCGDFGRYRKEVARIGQVRELLRASGESVRSWIRRTRPGLASALTKKRGHMGEALDWLGGSVNVPVAQLHPILVSVASTWIAAMLRGTKLEGGRLSAYFSLLAPGVEAQLLSMPLAQRVFSW
uniref:Uncharacterized protein n=1 Tax=viral metagenome TaxID=1070528 RepID=A0A2V0RHU3_9ZZZZ